MSYHYGKLLPNMMSCMSEGTTVAVIIAHKDIDNSNEKGEDGKKSPIYLRPVPEYLFNPEKINPDASIAERMELIGSEWASRIRMVFPELAELERAEAEGQNFWANRVSKQQAETPSLPKEAPALWDRDKQPGDTPPDFIQRHWINKGLTRIDIYHRDPKLLKALNSWARENSLPEGFNLQPPLWAKAHEQGDTPPAFIQRYYGKILGKWLTQADLRHLDPQLESAWRQWKRKNVMPEGFNLPTKSEWFPYDASDDPPPEVVEARRIVWRWDKRVARIQSHR